MSKEDSIKKNKTSKLQYTWDKKKFIVETIETNRNLDWYIFRYKRNLTISLIFSVLIFINASISTYVFKQKSDNVTTYLTASSGEIIKYKMSDEKKQKLNKALQDLRKGN
tara:strand:- start:32642 stop:32971 length:330 start_codon:yes stop_codon:yes gene_type:complete